MLALPSAVFAILSGLIEARSGLHYPRAEADLLAAKVTPRALELGFDSLLDYYYFLRYDPRGSRELDALIETIAVHETYFSREAEQLTVLVDSVLAPMVDAGGRPRVWCAAAASGEEPYTLAMLLDQREVLGQVELIASDLSAPLVAHAQHGRYSGRALRAVAGTIAGRWLEPQGDEVQVSPQLRDAISWRTINLIAAEQVRALGQFDAILCRNALIYFRDETATRVVSQLTAALKIGGRLLVGACESLLHFGTSLGCEERGGSFFYRRSA